MINVYEVEVRVLERPGQPEKGLTLTEYAYNVSDAVIQASLHYSAQDPAGELKLVRVGPPMEAILGASQRLADDIARLSRLAKKAPVTG